MRLKDRDGDRERTIEKEKGEKQAGTQKQRGREADSETE